MNLFQWGAFMLHSGRYSNFKIECDALTSEDWETLAALVGHTFSFTRVVGVPTGGLKFAEYLSKYTHRGDPRVLICDDVLTTGASMEAIKTGTGYRDAVGVVVFARGKCPDWITPIFQMWETK